MAKFIDKVKKVLNDWFTEIDNKTFDVTKVLAVISIVTAIGLAIFSVVYQGQPFDFQDYGLGTAALFAGVGIAFSVKKETPHE
jgi:hypothetical protein